MKAAIFTIDTGLYRAKKESKSAASLRRVLEQVGFEVRACQVLPEDAKVLSSVLTRLADARSVDLILTTGSVGVKRKDCAPETVEALSDRLLPGIPEAIRAYNIRHTKRAILDRSAAGIRKQTLILNLPESVTAAKESLEYVLPELVHAVELIGI